MRVDVFFGIQTVTAADIANRVVAVIDVLRASTSITIALANDAKNVIPFDSSEEAVNRSKSFERSEVRLAGERKILAIPGFDLGNSPREFTRDAVEGKTILMSTTNGTATLAGVTGARDVLVASYVNLSAVLAMLRSALRGGTEVVLICAGSERQFALEDAACAGRYARAIAKRVPEVAVNDGTQSCMLLDKKYGDNIQRLFQDSTHGKALIEAGFEEDLPVCAAVDSYSVVPVFQDRQITKIGPDRGR